MAFIESRKKQSGGEIIVSPIPVTSQMVTASSQAGGNFSGGMAFNGASCDISTLQGGWLASNSDNTPTLTVNFGRSYTLGKIVIETANNNNPDTDRDVYIEGSNDGSTWVNILATGSTTSLSFIVGEYTQYTINLNEGNYQYLRIRGTQPFFGGSYQYACCFSEIIIYDRASQSGGGGTEFDVLIDWTLYSHISAFDSISMPANYTDYDHLAIAVIQDNVDQDYMKYMLNAYLQSYVDTGYSNNTLFLIDTANIELAPSKPAYQLPLLSGSTIGKSIDGWTNINSAEIVGYNYGWQWQNLYLICFGFND